MRILHGDHYTTPIYLEGLEHSMTHQGGWLVEIGCHVHPIGEWVAQHMAISRSRGAADDLDEYGKMLREMSRMICRIHGYTTEQLAEHGDHLLAMAQMIKEEEG
jgi:hypothetical protein